MRSVLELPLLIFFTLLAVGGAISLVSIFLKTFGMTIGCP